MRERGREREVHPCKARFWYDASESVARRYEGRGNGAIGGRQRVPPFLFVVRVFVSQKISAHFF